MERTSTTAPSAVQPGFVARFSKKMAGPQLEMLCDNLEDLPPVPTAAGYTLRTFRPGDEAGWCARRLL